MSDEFFKNFLWKHIELENSKKSKELLKELDDLVYDRIKHLFNEKENIISNFTRVI